MLATTNNLPDIMELLLQKKAEVDTISVAIHLVCLNHINIGLAESRMGCSNDRCFERKSTNTKTSTQEWGRSFTESMGIPYTLVFKRQKKLITSGSGAANCKVINN